MKFSRDAETDSSTGGGLVAAFLGFGGALAFGAAFFAGAFFGADSNSSSLSSSREKSSSPARALVSGADVPTRRFDVVTTPGVQAKAPVRDTARHSTPRRSSRQTSW